MGRHTQCAGIYCVQVGEQANHRSGDATAARAAVRCGQYPERRGGELYPPPDRHHQPHRQRDRQHDDADRQLHSARQRTHQEYQRVGRREYAIHAQDERLGRRDVLQVRNTWQQHRQPVHAGRLRQHLPYFLGDHVYEAFFGLAGRPFQLNPAPAFFYGSRGHKRAFAYLQYGVHQGEGFIVITGEVGAGKTTLVRSLIEQIDSSQFVAAQLVTTQLDAEDLLRAVAMAFGLAPKALDKAQLLGELEAFLVSLVAQGKRALLIVDEAQNLSARAIEELRMLSNFQLGNQGLLQSFLVGQPELRQLMQGPLLQQL